MYLKNFKNSDKIIITTLQEKHLTWLRNNNYCIGISIQTTRIFTNSTGCFYNYPSTVGKSDILSTKDGFVILETKAKKAKILNSTMNKFEPNWSTKQVLSARKQLRHFWINFWLPGVVTWRYFSNLPKKQIQINSGIPPAHLSSHWILYFSTWQRRYILFRGVSIASRWVAYFTSQSAGHLLWAASVSARVPWEG